MTDANLLRLIRQQIGFAMQSAASAESWQERAYRLPIFDPSRPFFEREAADRAGLAFGHVFRAAEMVHDYMVPPGRTRTS